MLNTTNENDITDKHTKLWNRYMFRVNEENKCFTSYLLVTKIV